MTACAHDNTNSFLLAKVHVTSHTRHHSVSLTLGGAPKHWNQTCTHHHSQIHSLQGPQQRTRPDFIKSVFGLRQVEKPKFSSLSLHARTTCGYTCVAPCIYLIGHLKMEPTVRKDIGYLYMQLTCSSWVSSVLLRRGSH